MALPASTFVLLTAVVVLAHMTVPVLSQTSPSSSPSPTPAPPSYIVIESTPHGNTTSPQVIGTLRLMDSGTAAPAGGEHSQMWLSASVEGILEVRGRNTLAVASGDRATIAGTHTFSAYTTFYPYSGSSGVVVQTDGLSVTISCGAGIRAEPVSLTLTVNFEGSSSTAISTHPSSLFTDMIAGKMGIPTVDVTMSSVTGDGTFASAVFDVSHYYESIPDGSQLNVAARASIPTTVSTQSQRVVTYTMESVGDAIARLTDTGCRVSGV